MHIYTQTIKYLIIKTSHRKPRVSITLCTHIQLSNQLKIEDKTDN